MLPFYPLNQNPAGHDVERAPRPGSRLEVRMQMLDDERKKYATMQLQTERQGHNTLTVAARAFHRGVVSLLATIAGQGQRLRQATSSRTRNVAPGDHICVPGVDC
jgi:hypothetical protein